MHSLTSEVCFPPSPPLTLLGISVTLDEATWEGHYMPSTQLPNHYPPPPQGIPNVRGHT